jgi:hypothetical protein
MIYGSCLCGTVRIEIEEPLEQAPEAAEQLRPHESDGKCHQHSLNADAHRRLLHSRASAGQPCR